MSGVYPTFDKGPVTYEVSATVKGGQLVEAITTGGKDKVKPAGAASVLVLGVALNDAEPAGSAPDGTSTPINYNWPHSKVAVGAHCEVNVTYAAAANFGDLLVAAASGAVTPLGGTAAATDARQVVGRCTEPGGVLLGAVGRADIF